VPGVRLYGPGGREVGRSDAEGRIRVPDLRLRDFVLEGAGGGWLHMDRDELAPGAVYIVKIAEPPSPGKVPPLIGNPTRFPPLAPWLTFLGPVAAVVGAAYLPPVGLLFPLGLGAGHVYAGDPARGMLVSAGSLVPVVTSVWSMAVGFEGGNFATAQATVGTLAATFIFLGYWGWAAADAYDIAVENEFRH